MNDYNPSSKQLDSDELNLLLSKNKRGTCFFIHKWIYWSFGKATRQHRVCSKCYKKQKNTEIIGKFKGNWIKDDIL